MKRNYDILKNLLNHNKNIKLKLDNNTNILNIYVNKEIILSLKLDTNDIESNSKLIYNSITSLDDVNMYIPKIFIK